LDISISESAIRAEEETPGEPADAVVWEQWNKAQARKPDSPSPTSVS
jgi:hypothetical protein